MRNQELQEQFYLSEALKSLKIDGQFYKQKPPLPDFKVELGNDSFWVELTSLTNAEPKTESVNHNYESLCRKAQDKLLEICKSEDMGHLVVSVFFIRPPKFKDRDLAVDKIVEATMNGLKSGNTVTQLRNIHKDIGWLFVNHSPRARKSILVVSPFAFASNHEFLQPRVERSIKAKEAKNYRKLIGDAELWLLITLLDNHSIPDDLKLIDLSKISSIFNRIIIQLDYYPGLGYPLAYFDKT